MAAAADAPDRAGAIILIENPASPTDPFVLLGLETKYLTDVRGLIDIGDGRGLRHIHDDLQKALPKEGVIPTLADAHATFMYRADKITRAIERTVLYDTPKKSADGTYFTTNYRIEDASSRWSLPKGGLEKDDKGSLEACILRELREELTFAVSSESLKRVATVWNYAIYTYTTQIPKKHYDGLVTHFTANRIAKHRGEFMKLSAVPYSQCIAHGFALEGHTLNAVTFDALYTLKSQFLGAGGAGAAGGAGRGGGRRKTRANRRAKRAASKHRSRRA
jgi:8-oxo-dGTP pyrophosphatase MutT (NUDIX family)